jgi:hypothetical protein
MERVRHGQNTNTRIIANVSVARMAAAFECVVLIQIQTLWLNLNWQVSLIKQRWGS